MKIINETKQDFTINYESLTTDESLAVKALIIARFNVAIYLPAFKSKRFTTIGSYLLSRGGSVDKN